MENVWLSFNTFWMVGNWQSQLVLGSASELQGEFRRGTTSTPSEVSEEWPQGLPDTERRKLHKELKKQMEVT